MFLYAYTILCYYPDMHERIANIEAIVEGIASSSQSRDNDNDDREERRPADNIKELEQLDRTLAKNTREKKQMVCIV